VSDAPVPQPALAHLIRRRRLELRLTQRAVAHAAGLSVSTWQALERPRDGGTVKHLTLARAAHALDLPLDDLLHATAGETSRLTAAVEAPPALPAAVEEQLEELAGQLRALAAEYEDELRFVLHMTRELIAFARQRPRPD
jgi:transcriptional regulator with XRE-family HTH domain